MNDLVVPNFVNARLNITWAGSNGDLPDHIPYDASDAEIRTWATEAIQTGGIPGIQADPMVRLDDFVIDRFPATAEIQANRIFLRPKTPFGLI